MKNPPTKGAVQKISFRVRLNNKKSKIFDKKGYFYLNGRHIYKY